MNNVLTLMNSGGVIVQNYKPWHVMLGDGHDINNNEDFSFAFHKKIFII